MRDELNFAFCIGGFLQNTGIPTGIVRLHEQMIQMQSPRVTVRLCNWNEDWAEIAAGIAMRRAMHPSASVTITVAAYSLGVGWGAVQFAKRLRQWGLTIAHLTSADGVARDEHPFLRLVRYLRPSAQLVVPSNIRHVTPFQQRRNWPQGHTLTAENPHQTTIVPATILDLPHEAMDDAPEFHAHALSAASAYHLNRTQWP